MHVEMIKFELVPAALKTLLREEGKPDATLTNTSVETVTIIPQSQHASQTPIVDILVNFLTATEWIFETSDLWGLHNMAACLTILELLVVQKYN